MGESATDLQAAVGEMEKEDIGICAANLIAAISRCADSSSLVLQLHDGRLVRGKLICVDSSMNFVLQDAYEEFEIPWPSLDAVFLDRHPLTEAKRPDEEAEGCAHYASSAESEKGEKRQVTPQTIQRFHRRTIVLGSQIKSVKVWKSMYRQAQREGHQFLEPIVSL